MAITVPAPAQAQPDGDFTPDAKHLIRFRPDIEGLRAVAVMLVVADHLKIPGFKGGFLGVDVFFVISGYLITSLLAGEFARSVKRSDSKGGSISIAGFYMRRARRILPASLLVIACALIAGKIWFNEIRFQELQADALWATFFGANLHLMQQATDYFQQGVAVSPIQNYWSLAVEEQFYVVWPAIFVLAGRAGWKRRSIKTNRWHRAVWRDQVLATIIVLTAASLIWSIIATADNPAGAYFSPFTRAYELGIGAIVAMGAHRLTRIPARVAAVCGVAGLLLFALGMVVIGPSTPYPGAVALIPTLGAALIIIAGLARDSSGPAATALSVKPARFLGRISYSLYLWHWPIIVFAAALYPGLDGAARVAVLLPICIAISYASYRFVEQPFRTVGKGLSGPTELWRKTTGRVGKLQLEAMALAAIVVLGCIAAWARPVPPPTDLLASASPQMAQWATYGANTSVSGSASSGPDVKPDPFTQQQWLTAVNAALTDNRLTADEIKQTLAPNPNDPCFGVTRQVDVNKCHIESAAGSSALHWPAP